MSSQIVLATDPMTTSNPFLGSGAINQMCLNATEWIADQHAFQQTAMQFGYFCLVTGAFVGFIAGYFYAKRRYGDL
jgi:hypothetical protein